ncbi:MAG: hypothetical protein M3081_15235, partial [Gemmatimonadota bacterium]|nr:hypothetical protein [Gemmatimonadota bacterium]
LDSVEVPISALIEREPDEGADVGDISSTLRILEHLTVNVLDRLPPDVGRLAWHRLVEGAHWSTIGQELGTTAPAAKRRFQRAQSAVRRLVVRAARELPEPERTRVTTFLAEHARP